MWLKELFLKEDDRSTAVFAFGRFNPPTIGHQQLIEKVQSMTKQVNGRGYIFLSHTQNPKKDPLSFNQKLAYLQMLTNDSNLEFGHDEANTIIKALQVIQAQGRTRVVMVAGSDRTTEFQKLLNQYNGKPDKKGKDLYKFDDIQVVSAGERDPDAEGVTGASASKAREFAQTDDFANFSKIVMGGERSKTIYQMIQNAMGVKVAMNNEKLYNEDMENKPIVYVDMDGVIADFFGGVEKLYGVGHWKELNADNKLDLKQEVINRISGTDFFATLPEFPTADQLIDMVKKFTGGTFSILTSPLRGDQANSGKYKKIWIEQHIETPAQTIVTGRKETYAKDKASGTPNILIDDRPVNIKRWQDAGGYGILYQANRDPLTKVEQALNNYGKI
jgi:hypothetical protein